MGQWSLGGPSAEAVTSETRPSEEALERRTRRTHCGRPRDKTGVDSTCLGSVCVGSFVFCSLFVQMGGPE